MCLQFPIWKTSHTVKWEGVWRELGCLARTASFAVRQESGHSLKSSLSVRASVRGCLHALLQPHRTWGSSLRQRGAGDKCPGWVERWCVLSLNSRTRPLSCLR